MERFTSRFNRVIAIAAWVVVAGATIAYLVSHRGIPQPLWLLPAALIAFTAWTWLWCPAIEVDDAGVTLRNPARTVHVPWSALIEVETRFALTLVTPTRRYSAWAAPAPGRTGVALARRRQLRAPGMGIPGVTVGARPGDLPGTESGEAAAIIRTRWHELRESGRIEIGVAAQTRVRIQVLWWQDAVLLALLAGCVLAVALG